MGVPPAWTRLLRAGDRFAQVLRMLDRMATAEIDPEAGTVAVIGPEGIVQLEAHRTALDLASGSSPRPVAVLPVQDGGRRGQALAKALAKVGQLQDGVVALETDGYQWPDAAVEALNALNAEVVIAVVDAQQPIEATQAWLDAIGQIDAICVDGATETSAPAAALQLGLPVVRLDGIPVDRVTWAALLCAHLEAANPSR